MHNCYNGIGIWFYQALAGIRPDPERPGYTHFFVDPQPCNGVDWVRSTKPLADDTITVEINYSHTGTSTNTSTAASAGTMIVHVPDGTTATVFPGTSRERTLAPGTWTLPIGKQ